jgi:2,3-bisphosphoglycerate-dependent phosphoglycerate mutase
MTFDHLSDTEIAAVNVPTGVPLVYEFADDGSVQKKYYLGNPDEIAAKMKAVANQGKAK